MGYVFRTQNTKAPNCLQLDSVPSVMRSHPLSKQCHLLEKQLYRISQQGITRAGFTQPTFPDVIDSRYPFPNTPKVVVEDVNVVVDPHFRLICQHTDCKIEVKPVTLTLHLGPDLIRDFKKIIRCMPAMIAHELGHMAFPAGHFQGSPLEQIALPFKRNIHLPNSLDLQDNSYRAWEEMCIDAIGLRLMPEFEYEQEIRTSFLELSKLCLSEVLKNGQQIISVSPFAAIRFVAMIKHLNGDAISEESLALIRLLLKNEATNALLDNCLSYLNGITVSKA